ncbi:MAG: flavin reductase [Phycisphaerae bacterium]|nr:flavin reductase [Phycisphaerae bacterium]
MDWTPANRPDVAAALDRIPAGSFLLTSSYGDQRGGVPVKWVQQCCDTPPMVMVAVEKGHALSPVIRDSRAFAVCQLDPADRGTLRSFEQQQPGMDPFVGVLATQAPSGAPVPCRALAFVDCELSRHVDIDGDHEIYVGIVHHASLGREPVEPGHCLCGKPTRTPTPAATLRGMKIRQSASSAYLNGDGGSRANGSLRSNGKASSNGARRSARARPKVRATGAREAAAKLDGARKRK